MRQCYHTKDRLCAATEGLQLHAPLLFDGARGCLARPFWMRRRHYLEEERLALFRGAYF